MNSRENKSVEEEKQLGICGNGGMFSQSSLSSESGKQMDPAKVLGMLLPWAGKRVSRPFPSAEARPVPSCPGSCVSGLSEPPGQVPSLEQAGNRHEELRAGPAPAPAAGVCLHRVIWFQSSEILKLSTGTSSILNAFRTGWTNPARRTVSSWAAAAGLAPPPLLAHKSRSRHGWGLRDLGPAPLRSCCMNKALLPPGLQSPRLYSGGLTAGSTTVWVRMQTPPRISLCDFGQVTVPPGLPSHHL